MATSEQLNRSFEQLEALVAERMSEVNTLREENKLLREALTGLCDYLQPSVIQSGYNPLRPLCEAARKALSAGGVE